METMHLSRLRARYHLAEDDSSTRARLDGILRTVVDESLDGALDRCGVATREEICIRAARASVRLHLGKPDASLAARWSVALAESIKETIEIGGPGVVRYATVTHALADLLDGVARNDFGRAWAWRQLDLWRIGDAPSGPTTVAEAVHALLARPTSLLGALTLAARGEALNQLAVRIPVAAWEEVARAALQVASAPVPLIARILDDGALLHRLRASEHDGGTADGDGRVGDGGTSGGSRDAELHIRASSEPSEAVVDRHIAASAITRTIRGLPASETRLRRLLSVLALLESEPGELLRHDDRPLRLIATIARLGAAASDPIVAADVDARPARHPGDRPHGAEAQWPKRVVKNGEGPSPNRIGSSARPVSDGGDLRPEAAGPKPPLAIRTEWGGLLFLLPVVAELGITERIAADPDLDVRGLRWVLHRLARVLLALDERDPAALAFAGIDPDRHAPAQAERPTSEAEDRALAAIANLVAGRFHERLGGLQPSGAGDAAATVRRYARRSAAIRYSPGWIDVVLRLEDVSVELRRAGLDLDPGWIPWLGVVVRFVYE